MWIVTAFLLLVVSNGAFTFPPAAWLAPVFMLHFLRTSGVIPAFTIGYAAYCIALVASWWSITPVRGIMFLIYVCRGRSWPRAGEARLWREWGILDDR